jgi:transposase
MSEIHRELLDEMTPAVRAFVESLLGRQVEQERRIAELEAQLAKTSRNSSKPPSAEHPHAKPEPKKDKPKRKRGAQAGHRKFERELISTDQCDEVVCCKPDACRGCGHALQASDLEPLRQARTRRRPMREEEGCVRGRTRPMSSSDRW